MVIQREGEKKHFFAQDQRNLLEEGGILLCLAW